MKKKIVTIKASAFEEAITLKERYLNIAYDKMVHLCKEPEPDKALILLLCSYLNTLKTTIAMIADLLTKQVDGTIVINQHEAAIIRSRLKILRFYKNEITTNFHFSLELH